MSHFFQINKKQKEINKKKTSTVKRSKTILLVKALVFVLLTLVTQIGGIIYLISLALTRRQKKYRVLFILSIFISFYTLATFYIIPEIASIYGREKIKSNSIVQPHSLFYSWSNRNYVTPELHQVLQNIGDKMSAQYTGIKLVYLDANFPFLDGFPLLPHRYHNDGKKIDITFVYQDGSELTNKKPSFSGYGVFEPPLVEEWNQINQCLQTGYSQYEFTKFITFGSIHPQLTFSEAVNREFLINLLADDNVHTIFLEPHLKTRLGLENEKFVYHGCGTVRHDDHIHIEVN